MSDVRPWFVVAAFFLSGCGELVRHEQDQIQVKRIDGERHELRVLRGRWSMWVLVTQAEYERAEVGGFFEQREGNP